MAQSLPMTSSPPVKRFDWSNRALRVASATVMLPATLAAIFFFDGVPFFVMVAVGVALLSFEWGGMSAPVSPTRVAAAVAAAVLIAVFVGYRGDFIWAWEWGRAESPTEFQFRGIERRTQCTVTAGIQVGHRGFHRDDRRIRSEQHHAGGLSRVLHGLSVHRMSRLVVGDHDGGVARGQHLRLTVIEVQQLACLRDLGLAVHHSCPAQARCQQRRLHDQRIRVVGLT